MEQVKDLPSVLTQFTGGFLCASSIICKMEHVL